MTIDNIKWLEDFYLRLSDGDWEHSYGFSIRTLDNPGWEFEANLTDSILETVEFDMVRKLRTDDDWIIYKRDGVKFVAFGGPQNLNEIISIFREWVETHLKPDQSPWK